MGKPLFTAKEEQVHKDALQDIWDKQRACGGVSGEWDRLSKESESLRQAHLMETVKRVQARAEDYLNALIVLVGRRGSQYVEFEKAFANCDAGYLAEALKETDSPETRRTLHTFLKAMTEIPKSWASSAFIRFMRGIGKQKEMIYHGAGTMGPLFGWKEREVHNIIFNLCGDGMYSKVLQRYEDMQEAIRNADPEFEVVDYSAQFKATNVERDLEFINKLCEMLRARGLGPVPTPSEKPPQKPRKVKKFEPGDKIAKASIRDLPLPAHVRLNITKWPNDNKTPKTGNETQGTLDIVVTRLVHGTGSMGFLVVKPDTDKAYEPEYMGYRANYKDNLIGATFLGKWKGQVVKGQKLKTNFYFEWRK